MLYSYRVHSEIGKQFIYQINISNFAGLKIDFS